MHRPRARRPDPDAPLPRLAARRSTSSTSATTRGSTRSRPRRCGSSSRELEGWNRARREAAERYRELLGDLVETPADEPGHVYHLFVCRSPERDRIVEALREAGIGTNVYYLPPLHLQPALRSLGWSDGDLPETERAAAENFSLPLWAGIAPEQQERVAGVVREAVGARVA